MKSSIQTLCQSIQPLGKSIDFVTEDMDQMEKEYTHWQSEFSDTELKLREQEKINDEALQPVQDKLALVEEQIREMKSKI